MDNFSEGSHPEPIFKFEGLKKTYDQYTLGKDSNGELIAIDRNTRAITYDPLVVDMVKFSVAWAKSTQVSHLRTTTDTFTDQDYQYAFNDGAKETYGYMMACIARQLHTTGNIDPFEIIKEVGKTNYKYAEEYVRNLFSKLIYVEALDKWARHAISNAMPATRPLMDIDKLASVNARIEKVNAIKDISKSHDIFEVFLALKQLNPDVDIRLAGPARSEAYDVIFASAPGKDLILPKGFYYNEKNGVTNKHRVGEYAAFHIDDVTKYDENIFIPKDKEEEYIRKNTNSDLYKMFNDANDQTIKDANVMKK